MSGALKSLKEEWIWFAPLLLGRCGIVDLSDVGLCVPANVSEGIPNPVRTGGESRWKAQPALAPHRICMRPCNRFPGTAL